MNIKIDTEGAFGSAIVVLEPGEKFVSEAGAMYRASPNMSIEVESRRKKDEGLWGAFKSGMKAMFAGESFFLSSYQTTDNTTAEVGLAPTHQGEVRKLEVGSDTWYFYFDQKTYALKRYQFFHDESLNDGEYIILEDELEIAGIRMPKDRSWFYNSDNTYLGKDTLSN
mgnify:CR=1 FL=1